MKTQRPVSGETIPDGWFGDFWDDVHACELSGGPGVRVNRTPNGTTVSALRNSSGGSGGGMIYNGYFKVVDASETAEDGTKTLKVKVIDGADTTASNCGYARVNNKGFWVQVFEGEVSGNCKLYLKSTLSTSDPFDPQQPVIALLSEEPDYEDGACYVLIARVFVSDSGALSIVQEHHGEIQAIIWGTCDETVS